MEKRVNLRNLKANEIKFKFIFLGFLLVVSNQVSISTSYGSRFQNPPPSIAFNDLTRDYWPTEGWQVSTPAAQNEKTTIRRNVCLYARAHALGYAGQLIFIAPQHDLVVVFTSFEETHWPYSDVLVQHIFSSVENGADPRFSIGILVVAVVVVGFILMLGYFIIRRNARAHKVFMKSAM